MHFSIIIPTHNRESRLKRCISSIAMLDYPTALFEVIIVSDGQTLDITQLTEFQHLVTIRHFSLSQKRGPAACRNLGVKHANGKYLAFTDDDCIVDKHWLTNLYYRFSIKDYFGIGGKTLSASKDKVNAYMEYRGVLNPRYLSDGTPSFLVTCNCCYERNKFIELGGFDETFQLAGGEDTDLSYKARIENLQLVYDKDCVIWHDFETSVSSLFKRFHRYGVGTRQFFEKYKTWDIHIPITEQSLFLLMNNINRNNFRYFTELENQPNQLYFALMKPISDVAFAAGYLYMTDLAQLYAHKWNLGADQAIKPRQGELSIEMLEHLFKNTTVSFLEKYAGDLYANIVVSKAKAKDPYFFSKFIIENLNYSELISNYSNPVPAAFSSPTLAMDRNLASDLRRKRHETFSKKYDELYKDLQLSKTTLKMLQEKCFEFQVDFQSFLRWFEKNHDSKINGSKIAI